MAHGQDSEPITAVAWSPDGRSVYTASRSLQQKRWDIGAGACRRSWKARVSTRSTALTADLTKHQSLSAPLIQDSARHEQWDCPACGAV